MNNQLNALEADTVEVLTTKIQKAEWELKDIFADVDSDDEDEPEVIPSQESNPTVQDNNEPVHPAEVCVLSAHFFM